MNEPELAIIVDEHDAVIEFRDRRDVGRYDLHRIVAVWVVNQQNQVLIARRAGTLMNQPNLWGPAAAGTVAKGEEYADTARRELAEEVGIKDMELTQCGVFMTNQSFGESRMCAVFTGAYNGDISTLKLQTEEVSEVRWVDIQDLAGDIAANPDSYVINMSLVYNMIKKD